jgi:integrase
MEGNMRKRLTDALVKNAPLPATGKVLIWDEPDNRKLFVSGFGVRIAAGGTKSFVLRYRRKADGRERQYTIGAFPVYSTDAARNEALELRRRIKDGGDPVQEQRDHRGAPDMSKLCDRFIAEHLPLKRAGTRREYRGIIEGVIRPTLGRKRVDGIDNDDIQRLHSKITERGALHRANRVVAVVSKMFVLAIRWRWRETNPARGIVFNPETKRKRYLTPDELKRLTAALARHESQDAANVFRLLLLTGARSHEVMTARWDQFDLEHRQTWTKLAGGTKQKRDHEVPLGGQALDLLRSMRKAAPEDAEFLFPGRTVVGHRSRLNRAWTQICKAAGIPRTGPQALRVHDLRHSFASFMVSSGFSLPVIGALLGHSQPMTTARYAHLLDDPLREAANKVGSLMGGLVAKPSKRKRAKLRVVKSG